MTSNQTLILTNRIPLLFIDLLAYALALRRLSAFVLTRVVLNKFNINIHWFIFSYVCLKAKSFLISHSFHKKRYVLRIKTNEFIDKITIFTLLNAKNYLINELIWVKLSATQLNCLWIKILVKGLHKLMRNSVTLTFDLTHNMFAFCFAENLINALLH